jgi:hypothetical protein
MMLPGNWLAFAMIFFFALIFGALFWQAKRQGLLKGAEDIKYKVFEEDEQDFQDVI